MFSGGVSKFRGSLLFSASRGRNSDFQLALDLLP
jgi:hypothetical protein